MSLPIAEVDVKTIEQKTTHNSHVGWRRRTDETQITLSANCLANETRARLILPWRAEVDKTVIAVKAQLEIAGLTLKKSVRTGSKGVVFELELPAGPTELVTKLFDKNGKFGGAYFTEVEAL